MLKVKCPRPMYPCAHLDASSRVMFFRFSRDEFLKQAMVFECLSPMGGTACSQSMFGAGLPP